MIRVCLHLVEHVTSDMSKEAVMALLEQHNEEPAFIGWVDKKKRGKVQKRLLVVGHNRILSVKPGGKLAREGHLLDLKEIKSINPREVG